MMPNVETAQMMNDLLPDHNNLLMTADIQDPLQEIEVTDSMRHVYHKDSQGVWTEVGELEARIALTTNLMENISEYLTFSTPADLIKIIASLV